MSLALMTIVLGLGWALTTNDMSVPNIAFGAVIAGAALFLVRDKVAGPGFLRRLRRVAALAWLFSVELLASALRVARLVIRPDMTPYLKPGIVAFPLTATRDAEITTLANLITLTPGTLSLDVSDDRKVLFVHAIDVSDRQEMINDIARGFESKVMEAYR